MQGFRIELGEIEAVLGRHFEVAQAAVTVREPRPGDKRLVAHLVAEEGGDPTPAALRAHLAAELPDYIVPSVYVTLDALPLTGNGKIDRRALPVPNYLTTADATVESRAPRTPREEILCGFAVGDAADRRRRRLFRPRRALTARHPARGPDPLGPRAELTVRQLFDTPTVAALSRALDTAGAAVRACVRPIPARSASRPPPRSAAVVPAPLRGPEPDVNIPFALRLTGDLDRSALRAALADLTDRHESLRTVFAEDAEDPGR
ncbi:Amino acid adenylation domain-containing protein OS=Streptomyces tendae OX=1932 GN=GUR47_35325 PE=4 SV=1 [Streptomyces tendae]